MYSFPGRDFHWLSVYNRGVGNYVAPPARSEPAGYLQQISRRGTIKNMALSNDELQSQSADYLPAREVMSLLGGGCGWGCGSLVNVNVHDVDIVKDINIFTGKDSDVVDIDNILIGGIL